MVKGDLTRREMPLLVTSPESLGGALYGTLKQMADAGRVAALVVDEAHLITQWGHDFRPDFRELATLRQEILASTERAGHPALKTILMSATQARMNCETWPDCSASPGRYPWSPPRCSGPSPTTGWRPGPQRKNVRDGCSRH